jgi:hypothetical protein
MTCARVQRGESATARCASIGNRQAAFLLSLSFFLSLGGSDQAALDCVHRMIYMVIPSLLVVSLGMGAD